MYTTGAVDEDWCMEHSESLIKYKRARKPSLWLLAWGSRMPIDPECPYSVYNIAKQEEECLLRMWCTCVVDSPEAREPPLTIEIAARASEVEPRVTQWSPTEQKRVDKALIILSVPRAVYMAAMELDPSVTITSIQRKWLMPRDIQEARERHLPFITKMMIHERRTPGFIGKHIVLAKDLHKRNVCSLLTRTTAIIALHDRACVWSGGECVWCGSYDIAYETLLSAL